MTKKRISVLGSTGTIGQKTVNLLQTQPEKFEILTLVAHSNADLLATQAKLVGAKQAIVADVSAYEQLKSNLFSTKIKAAAGQEAILEALEENHDWVMVAIVGAAGIEATFKAVQHSRVVALANKETIVCAGPLLLEKARQCRTTILPVDSEHNAIFQVWDHHQPETVSKIILTASGGPFRSFSAQSLQEVTPDQAIRHPNWRMGPKISVDSATLMNKGLELIEACYLFQVDESKVDVVVHPESIIHSLVGYKDGSYLAQLSYPDMITPIAHTLAWPGRMDVAHEPMDLVKIGQLHFFDIDHQLFPAIHLARQAFRLGMGGCIALNAANEVLVQAFLQKQLPFMAISYYIKHIMADLSPPSIEGLDDVVNWDRMVRQTTNNMIKRNPAETQIMGKKQWAS